MLDIDKIKQLIEMMVANDLVEVSLRDGQEEVNLRRPNSAMPLGFPEVTVGNVVNTGAIPAPGQSAIAPQADESATEDESGFVEIASPMVGTYYSASDPESPPFAKVGQKVHVGMVVCILEAMKVFNEIKSEVAGTIEKILVKNAATVEFGQPLFVVRPD